MMKKGLLLLAVLPALFFSCSNGDVQEDVEKELTIKVDSETLDIDESQKVNFTVLLGDEDVSASAQIIEVTNGGLKFIESANDYTTLKPGNHIFKALYDTSDGKNYGSTNSVIVNAFSESGVSGTFYRRTFTMKFTGTWCTACPAMSKALDKASKDMPNRISKIAVHSGDKLANDFGNKLMERYSITSLPTLYVNGFGSNYDVPDRSSLEITKKIEETIAQNPTVVGIKMDTKIDASNLLTVDVEVNAAADGKYKLACYLTQSGYKLEQSGTNDPNYTQNDVLLAALQSDKDDSMEEVLFGKVIGESLSGMSTSEKVEVQYTMQLPAEMTDFSQTEVVAFVINDSENDGIYEVNNSRTASLNETQMYEYEVVEE